MVLLISNFSSALPPIVSKLIGHNLDGSRLPSLPGLVTGIILAIFQFYGKHPLLKHSL